jgi:nicotinamidase/pyrazinamidase
MKAESQLVHINVDVQNDFCPGGSLAVPEGDRVVPFLNSRAQFVRANGGTVIHTRDWHPPVTSHFDGWPVHCVADTPGAAFHPDLDVQPSDIIITKGTEADENNYSGFEGHDAEGRTMAEVLRSLGKGHLLVTIGGLATDYCVKATVIDAVKASAEIPMRVYALTDGMRAVNVNPDDGANALDTMNDFGAILTSTELANRELA